MVFADRRFRQPVWCYILQGGYSRGSWGDAPPDANGDVYPICPAPKIVAQYPQRPPRTTPRHRIPSASTKPRPGAHLPRKTTQPHQQKFFFLGVCVIVLFRVLDVDCIYSGCISEFGSVIAALYGSAQQAATTVFRPLPTAPPPLGQCFSLCKVLAIGRVLVLWWRAHCCRRCCFGHRSPQRATPHINPPAPPIPTAFCSCVTLWFCVWSVEGLVYPPLQVRFRMPGVCAEFSIYVSSFVLCCFFLFGDGVFGFFFPPPRASQATTPSRLACARPMTQTPPGPRHRNPPRTQMPPPRRARLRVVVTPPPGPPFVVNFFFLVVPAFFRRYVSSPPHVFRGCFVVFHGLYGRSHKFILWFLLYVSHISLWMCLVFFAYLHRFITVQLIESLMFHGSLILLRVALFWC